MQKFIRAVIGTNNIDGCARVCHSPTALGMQRTFGTGAATNSIADLKLTDCIWSSAPTRPKRTPSPAPNSSSRP
jgi:predicted molibdopterin-dependent oxidoreductase YjgC